MFKIGVNPIQGGLIIDNGRPKGIFGELFMKLYSFPANITWVAVERQENPLDYFAMDIDWPLTIISLPHLNENVTNGAVIGDDQCYLLSNRNKNIERVSSKFSTVFENIDMKVLIAIAGINLNLFLMLIIVLSRESLCKIITNYIAIFLRQKSVNMKKILSSAKFIIISCSIFFFLSQSIVLCYLQTEFVTVDNEIKINTFNDVKFYHKKMYVHTLASWCGLKNHFKTSKDIPLHLYSVPGQLEDPSLPGLLRPEVVVLTETTKYFREYGCSFEKKKDSLLVKADDIYYFSKKPVLNLITQNFFRKSSVKRFKAILTRINRPIDYGFTDISENVGLMVFRGVFGKSQDPSCTESDHSADNNIHPLKISYFIELSAIYIMAIIIACVIFAIENLYK